MSELYQLRQRINTPPLDGAPTLLTPFLWVAYWTTAVTTVVIRVARVAHSLSVSITSINRPSSCAASILAPALA